MMFETKNPGHENLTIGYKEYQKVVKINLEKIKHIGMSTGKEILGFPIELEDTETLTVTYNKESDHIDKVRFYLKEKR